MRSIVLITLLAAACASDQGPQSSVSTTTAASQPGRYGSSGATVPVGAIPDGVLHDANRNKDVTMTIEYPFKDGPYPVIIFSHGYGGSKDAYLGLTEYWASHGYVCIKPSHADAGALREMLREQRREVTPGEAGAPGSRRGGMGAGPYGRQSRTGGAREVMAESVWEQQGPQQWRDRVADVQLILDNLDTLVEKYPELKGRIDKTKVGVGGHSYGAFTAMLLGGAVATRDGQSVGGGDPRVKAIVAMSPQGTAADRGLTPASWANVKVPAMFMTGTLDRGPGTGEDAAWRQQAFDNSPPGDKYFVLIDGASHFSFTGRFAGGENVPYRPRDTQTGTRGSDGMQRMSWGNEENFFNDVKTTSITFWDAYLKDNADAREYLKNKITQRGGMTVTVK